MLKVCGRKHLGCFSTSIQVPANLDLISQLLLSIVYNLS